MRGMRVPEAEAALLVQREQLHLGYLHSVLVRDGHDPGLAEVVPGHASQAFRTQDVGEVISMLANGGSYAPGAVAAEIRDIRLPYLFRPRGL
jgi:hypothetical protein